MAAGIDRFRRQTISLAAAGCLLLPGTGQAAAAAARIDAERGIARCIRQAAGGRPWLEKTLWGLRDQEAGWVGAEIPNSNGSHDLGPLQINSQWVVRIAAATRRPPGSIRYWLIHDPCFNVHAARWIFLSGLAATRDYWRAVGAYHSPTIGRQRRYAAAVAVRLERRFGADVFTARTMRGISSCVSGSRPRPVVRSRQCE